MPPRKRKRPSDSQVTTSPAGSAANRSAAASSPGSRVSASTALDDDSDLPPFLNTTFSTYRVSPLYIGAQTLIHDRLSVLSQRLRDLLVGDVVRGVEVGLDRGVDDAAMRRAGALELVSMGWVKLDSLLGRYVGGESDELPTNDEGGSAAETTASPEKRRALQISLQYENTQCAALFLPRLRSSQISKSTNTSGQNQISTSASLLGFSGSGFDQNDVDFLDLPLLLLRMPAPLKTVIVDFISRNFDCRINSLSLGTRSLIGGLEKWMEESKIPNKGQFAKDVVLTLGFYKPAVLQDQNHQKEVAEADQADGDDDEHPEAQVSTVGVKAIDIIIPNADLRRFFRAGKMYESKREVQLKQSHNKNAYADEHLPNNFDDAKRRRLGGNKDEEGWTWRRWESPSKKSYSENELIRPQPFIEALAQYVRKHLALDMFHPAVRVTKIACGGFVLSEGRVKIFGIPPSSESEDGLSDTKQRAVWSVLDNLLERAQVNLLDQTLSGTGV